MEIVDDGYCFACGKENPQGLGLSFEKADGGVSAKFTPGRVHQGYRGIVHGGIISAVLDEAMAHAAIADGFMPVTAEMTVRFKKTLFTGQETVVEAKIEAVEGRLIKAEATLKRLSDMQTVAKGKAVFFRDG